MLHYPPGLFPGERSLGNRGNHYPVHNRGTSSIIKEMSRYMGVSQYQLRRLVDAQLL